MSACTPQFDFVKLLDGKQLLKQNLKGSEEGASTSRNLLLASVQETGFIEYMDPGTWYLAFYNDGKKMEQVFVLTSVIGNYIHSFNLYGALCSTGGLCVLFGSWLFISMDFLQCVIEEYSVQTQKDMCRQQHPSNTQCID